MTTTGLRSARYLAGEDSAERIVGSLGAGRDAAKRRCLVELERRHGDVGVARAKQPSCRLIKNLRALES